MKKIKVAVIMGGSKEEQDTSLRSGKDVLMNLNRDEFEPLPYILSEGGNIRDLLSEIKEDTDVAFVAMHGKHGRDGKVQGELEGLGVSHTGSHHNIHALCFNKHLSLNVVKQLGFNVPLTVYIRRSDWESKKTKVLSDLLHFIDKPWVVKPNRNINRQKIYFPKSPQELQDNLNYLFDDHKEVVVQPYIDGKFVTCGVLDVGIERSGQALYPIERIGDPGSGEYNLAKMSEGWIDMVRKVATHIHNSLGCRGKSQVDMVIDNKGIVHILEVNTSPELHRTSQMSLSAEGYGITYEDLLKKIIMSVKN